MVFSFPKTKFNFSATFNLLSANAFSLHYSTILLLGKRVDKNQTSDLCLEREKTMWEKEKMWTTDISPYRCFLKSFFSGLQIHDYSIACIQRPPMGNHKSGLL